MIVSGIPIIIKSLSSSLFQWCNTDGKLCSKDPATDLTLSHLAKWFSHSFLYICDWCCQLLPCWVRSALWFTFPHPPSSPWSLIFLASSSLSFFNVLAPTHSLHLEKHNWLEICHMETDAFRVHERFLTIETFFTPRVLGNVCVNISSAIWSSPDGPPE